MKETRRRKGWILGIITALALGAAPVALAQSAAPEGEAQAPAETFGGATDVVLVEVPVRVLDDGEPVRGLTAEDFRVFDGDAERPIHGFEVFDQASATGAAEVPFAARRHFLLLFDLDFTDADYLKRAHRAARELVDENLRPTDLVAVAFFSYRNGVSSLLGFTPDHGQVRAALDALGSYLGKETGDGAVTRTAAAAGEPAAEPQAIQGDALGLTVGEWEAVLNDLSAALERERSLGEQGVEWYPGTGVVVGKRVARRDLTAETLRDMAGIGASDMKQKRAARASSMASNLQALAEQYRWIDGQKFLVLFSRGFESDLYTTEGTSWLLTDLRRMVDGFRKAGWTIYSIEGIELNDPNTKARRESLVFLANETGGRLISGRDDLGESMNRVLEETDVTYLLAFQSPPLPRDGSFRELRVELVDGAGAPRGARVMHRAGYYTPKPFGEMGREERRVATAELLLAGREIDEIGCEVLASPAERTGAAGGGGAIRVPVVLDVDARSLLASRNWQATRVEAMSYAFDEAGGIAASWGRDFFLVPNMVAKATRAGSLVFYGELELPPGTYELRSLVRNVDDGRVTLRSSRLRVPGFDAGEPVLLEPIFADLMPEGEDPETVESDRRILLRDVTSGTGYPFTFGQRRFLPALAPAVVRGTETMVIGRGLWREPPSGLRALVMDESGFPVPGGVAVRFLGLDEPATDSTGSMRQLALGFQPTGLPAGEYELRLVFRAPDGGTVSSPPAAFRVVEATTEVR